MLDQIRMKLQNFNINTFLASVVATVASIKTEDMTSIIYFLIAVVAQLLTIAAAYNKMKHDSKMNELEYLIKKKELTSKD